MVMRKLKKELWPYVVTVDYLGSSEIEDWLHSTLGVFKGRWNMVNAPKNKVDFYFRNSNDALLFILKWS